MLRPALLLAALVLAGCSTPTRTYRLELDPLPAGSARQVSGNLLVDGKAEAITAPLPLVREWTATSLSGELTSPGEGGMRVRLIAKPEDSVERELIREGQGPNGIVARIRERNGDGTWAIQLDVDPLPAATPVPAPVSAPAAAPAP
jgi:hypothetical protein